MITFDVAIIGAGPIGIELAVALKRAGVRTIHLEAGQIGATIEWYAPETRFFSSPERIAISGVPLMTVDQSKATREEYLTYLRSVVTQFDLTINTYERVTDISPLDGDASGARFELTTQSRLGEHRYRAKNIVLAIGDMHKPRLLGIPGETLPHVSHYAADPHTYFRRDLVIVGGKNSAIEMAIRAWRAGANVTLIHRRGDISERVKYWLRPEFQALVKEEKLTFLPSMAPVEITPEHVIVRPVDEALKASGEARHIPADFVLLLTGYVMDPTLFQIAGIETDGKRHKPILNEQTMESSVPGIYVAGTATAGTQSGVTVFIENSHVHVERIVSAITKTARPSEALEAPTYQLPES